MNDFLNSLKGKIIGAITGIVAMFLMTQWDSIVETFATGENIEKQTEFNAYLIKAMETDSINRAFLDNDHFVEIFFNSPTVKKHVNEVGNELHAKIIAQRISKDSNKVSSRDYIGAAVNMHPDSVLPFQAKMVKFFKTLEDKGVQLTTDEDFETLKEVLEAQNIKTEKRRRRRGDSIVF